MKKSIRIVALFLCFVMCTVLISACGKKTTETGSKETKVEDLKGKTITFTAMGKGFFIPEEGADNYDDAMAFKDEVEKLYNCKIEFNYYSPWDVYFQKIVELTMAGESVGDIAAFDGYIYPSSMLTGIFMPIQDYIDTDNYDVWEKKTADYFNIKNNVYAVSTKISSGIPSMLCFYNKTMFEESGLASKYDLKSLVMNKEWTWDKFSEVLKASTLDRNGDGITDVWGLGAQGEQFSKITSSLVTSNNAAYAKKSGDGVKLTMTDPAFIEALEFASKLAWTDKVASTEDKWQGYDTLDMFASGQCMFYISTNWWIKTLKTMVDDSVISILPVPIGPKADDYVVNLGATNHTYGMLSTCANPEAAGMVFSYWMENFPNSEKTARQGWSDYVFDTDSLDVIEMLSELPYDCDWSTPNVESFNNVILGPHGILDRIPPTTYVASVKDSLQADIDKLWALAE